MKKEYKTPSIEKLEFDYTDVVVASITLIGNQGCEGSSISNPSGWTQKKKDGCEKYETVTSHNLNQCPNG